jgi:hypothetical protein
MIVGHVNFSMVAHNIHNYQDDTAKTKTWDGEDMAGRVLSGGLDFNYWGKNGIGLQYANILSEQGDGSQVSATSHYINLGTTFWLTETLALAARFAVWFTERDDVQWNNTSFEWEPTYYKEGERSLFVTLRKQF